MTCQPGCMVFDGGERKHRRDCEHYPESLTKLWHDTEAGYVAEIDRLRAALKELSCPHVTEKPLWWQIIARNALKPT